MNNSNFCSNCGRRINQQSGFCQFCGAPLAVKKANPSNYMGYYKVFKHLPAIYMISIFSIMFISSLVLMATYSKYLSRIIPIVLVIWVAGSITALITYFVFKIMISATVVSTDTLIDINDCLHSMADRGFSSKPDNASPAAATAAAAAPAAPAEPAATEESELLTDTDILAADKFLSTVCTSKAPDGIKKIKLSNLEDELKEYHKFFYLNPISESVDKKSFEYIRNTATGTADYCIDCYGDNRVKRVEIKYSDTPMGILANKSWMKECIYKKEQALSRYESTAVSCYCDLEILHCIIGDGNQDKYVLEAAVLDQICTLETQAVNGWKISVSASGNAVTIVADHPTTVI